MLSYDLWVRRYGRNPAIVGSSITVDGARVPVIGVLEDGISGTFVLLGVGLALIPLARRRSA